MKVFITSDSGGSGHGATGLGTVKQLLNKDIEINWSTHNWGWNLNGWRIGNPSRQFPDTRFREELIRTGRVNENYLLKSKREFKDRPHNLDELPFSNEEAKSSGLMIKDFDGEKT